MAGAPGRKWFPSALSAAENEPTQETPRGSDRAKRPEGQSQIHGPVAEPEDNCKTGHAFKLMKVQGSDTQLVEHHRFRSILGVRRNPPAFQA